jgi:hypothetical protein
LTQLRLLLTLEVRILHKKKAKTHVSPKGLLMEYINKLVVEAGESGVVKISGSASRTLHRR